MKEVLKKIEVVSVDISEVSVSKFYGAEKTTDGRKAFIIRSQHSEDGFVVISTKEMTDGNCYPSYAGSTLKQAIVNLKAGSDNEFRVEFRVFEFDTSKELFKWLAK